MFGIFKLFRVVGYWFTGLFGGVSDKLNQNPKVIAATFDAVIAGKKQNIGDYQNAVASTMADQEAKKGKLKKLTEEVVRLENIKSGAEGKGKAVSAKLKAAGKSKEEITQDAEYLKCAAAYKDASTSLEEKTGHIQELESDIARIEKELTEHKRRLKEMMQGVNKLKSEKSETISDVLASQQEKRTADLYAGISLDPRGEELEGLREMRQKARASARASRELSGIDLEDQEKDFLEYASATASNSEFEAAIGLTEPKEEVVEPSEPVKLPEA